MCPLTHPDTERGRVHPTSPSPPSQLQAAFLELLGRPGNSLSRSCWAQTQLLAQERHGAHPAPPSQAWPGPAAPGVGRAQASHVLFHPVKGWDGAGKGSVLMDRNMQDLMGFGGVNGVFSTPISKGTPKEADWMWMMLSCSAQTLKVHSQRHQLTGYCPKSRENTKLQALSSDSTPCPQQGIGMRSLRPFPTQTGLGLCVCNIWGRA